MNKSKTHRVLMVLISLIVFTMTGASYADTNASSPVAGINFPGPAIAGHVQPGKMGVNYHFPSKQDIQTYADFGFKLIRLAITWERLQPQLNGGFDTTYLGEMDDFIQQAEEHNLSVLLDVHNYGKYKGNLIGTETVPKRAFADLWFGLAQHYKNQDNLMFGLMNEPNKQDAETWSNIAQDGILAIRRAGAMQTIMVPATFYSSAARWLRKDGKYSNGEALKAINDPQNNIVFEAHQYLDKYSTGTDAHCVSDDIGVKRLTAFTGWLKQNGFKGFLGEFGASDSEPCQRALHNMLDYMNANSDVWFGWSYWVADPWFSEYMFNIYPPDTAQFPQAKILEQFVNK